PVQSVFGIQQHRCSDHQTGSERFQPCIQEREGQSERQADEQRPPHQRANMCESQIFRVGRLPLPDHTCRDSGEQTISDIENTAYDKNLAACVHRVFSASSFNSDGEVETVQLAASGGSTPSCCIRLIISASTQCSASFPLAMRQIATHDQVMRLPVGAMPKNSP